MVEGPPVALVTGAATGIGLEVCRQLAELDHHVVLTARTLEKASAAAARVRGADAGLRVTPLALDVTSDADAARVAATLEASPGRLDVLVNNAGRVADWTVTATATDLDEARATFETNLLGPWRVTTALLPLLRRSPHPRVVNVSSGAGSHGDEAFGLPMPGGPAAAYGISKAALNALTSKLAAELAGTGVLVNSVCPGLTATAPGMREMGARPVAEGAASVVAGVTLPDDGPSGGSFRDGAPLPW